MRDTSEEGEEINLSAFLLWLAFFKEAISRRVLNPGDGNVMAGSVETIVESLAQAAADGNGSVERILGGANPAQSLGDGNGSVETIVVENLLAQAFVEELKAACDVCMLSHSNRMLFLS